MEFHHVYTPRVTNVVVSRLSSSGDGWPNAICDHLGSKLPAITRADNNSSPWLTIHSEAGGWAPNPERGTAWLEVDAMYRRLPVEERGRCR